MGSIAIQAEGELVPLKSFHASLSRDNTRIGLGTPLSRAHQKRSVLTVIRSA